MKKYLGVYYWYDGGWFCDLLPSEPFNTLKELKFYIKDWKENN